MTERINAAELSRRLQVTRGAVSKAVKSGRIAPGEDGLFDAEEAARQWEANTRPAMKATASPAAKAKATGYAEARARKERALASMAEMDEAKARKALMDTQLCMDLLANLTFVWRGFVDTLPANLARAVRGKQSFEEIELAIETAINEHMAGLPDLARKATLQAGFTELPPSPLEKAILEKMNAAAKKRARAEVLSWWEQLRALLNPEPLGFNLLDMVDRLAKDVAPPVHRGRSPQTYPGGSGNHLLPSREAHG